MEYLKILLLLYLFYCIVMSAGMFIIEIYSVLITGRGCFALPISLEIMLRFVSTPYRGIQHLTFFYCMYCNIKYNKGSTYSLIQNANEWYMFYRMDPDSYKEMYDMRTKILETVLILDNFYGTIIRLNDEIDAEVAKQAAEETEEKVDNEDIKCDNERSE